MNREIIAVDIDDVLTDSVESLRPQILQLTGLNIDASTYHRSPGEYGKVYEATWERLGLGIAYQDLPSNMARDQSHMVPMKGAVEGLRRLGKENDLIVVTARNPVWRGATISWLERNFGEDVFREVFFIKEPQMGKAELYTKGDICIEQGAKYLIDDCQEFCLSAVELGVKAILFGEYAWHQGALPDDIKRCKDWQEVAEYFYGES